MVFGADREAYLSVALARVCFFLLEVMAFFYAFSSFTLLMYYDPTFPCSVCWGMHAWFALGDGGDFSGGWSDHAFDRVRMG